MNKLKSLLMKILGREGFQGVVRDELKKNRAVLESLKKYDKGEKEISTDNVERHLRRLQHSS